ncbi:MAG: hypothetical protein ACI8PZ_001732 [Myxococcota bacterium]|jgi:hypothetical protein
MRALLLPLPLLFLAACESPAPKPGPVDADADGFTSDLDCDDDDDSAYPNNRESCGDGIDNDCDGEIDEGDAWDAVQWHVDADGDGHGVPGATLAGCTAPAGYVAPSDDCDDSDSTVFPGAPEICDGLDNDCDDETPADAGAAGAVAWFADRDGDGYGDSDVSETACDAPRGFVDDDSDCDDGNGQAYPGAAELCGPVDEDCDPSTGDESAVDGRRWYADGDGDGFGDPAGEVRACALPADHVANATDCDDSRDDVNPDGVELCGVGDEDCDPATTDDDGVDASAWFPDDDGDGYGNDFRLVRACLQPAGHVSEGGDCDDLRDDVNPEGVEVCDGGVDNDCDPETSDLDDPIAREMWLDADGDGFGDPDRLSIACGEPLDDHVFDATDCDDGEALRNPGLPEICGDGIDNDCIDGLGDCGVVGDVNTGEADLTVGVAGVTTLAAGDGDGDGLAELVLGAPDEGIAGPGGGGVYLFGGPLEGVVGEGAAQAHLVGLGGDELGAALAAYGDANADGIGDWLVGAPGASEVYIVSGRASGLGLASGASLASFGGVPGARAGHALAAHPGGGFIAQDGAVVAVSGLGGALDDSPDRVIGVPDDPDVRIAASDLDGDGVYELVLGAPSAAMVWVVPGPVVGVVDLADVPAWLADDPGSEAGARVAAGGDVDGDGLHDAVVAGSGSQAWRVALLADEDRLLADAALIVDGVGLGGLAVLDDVDADGLGEVFLTDELDQAVLLSGPLAGSLHTDTAAWRVVEPGIGQWLGGADLTDDGTIDLVVSDGAEVYGWWGQAGL